jgi:type IV secretion system protein VirB6
MPQNSLAPKEQNKMAVVCPALPSGTGILTGLLAQVDCYTNNFIQTAYLSYFGNGTTFGHVLTGAMVLAVTFYGYAIWFGKANITIGDFGHLALKIGFIIALLAIWGNFSLLVVKVLKDAPEAMGTGLMEAIGTTATTTIGMTSAIDLFSSQMDTAFNSCMAQAGIFIGEPSMYVAALLIWLAKYGVMVFLFAFMLVGKLGVSLLLAIAPLFIGMYLFSGTKGLFEGWLRTTIGLALVPLMMITSAAMLLSIIGGAVAHMLTITAGALPFIGLWSDVSVILLVCLGFAIFFTQVPQICASISGGIALHGIAAATAVIGFAAARGAKMAGKAAGGTAVKGGALGYSMMRNPGQTSMELRAAGRRKIAGLGESAKFWNKIGTTHQMSNARRTGALKNANNPLKSTDMGRMMKTGNRPNRGPSYG